MDSPHSTESAFAAAIKTGRWANPEVLERLAEAHRQQCAELREAANRSVVHHRPRLAEALGGDAGDAMLKAHNENTNLWDDHAKIYETSGYALVNAAGELHGLNRDLDLLIDEKEPAYNTAMKRGNVVGAEQIMTSALAEADDMVLDRGERAKDFVQAVDFGMPRPERPASNEQDKPPSHDKQTDKPQKPAKATNPESAKDASNEASPAALDRDKQSDIPATSSSSPDSPVAAALTGHDKQTELDPATPASSVPATSMMGSRGSGSAGGGSGGGVGSGMSGLGSSMKPPTGLGSPGSGMPGGGGMPGGASTSPASATPLGNAGSSFQSGLTSGMSATGGGSAAPVSPVSQSLSQQQAAAAYAAQPPASAVPQVGSTPAGVPMSGGPSGADVGGGAAQGGSAAAPMGGGGMMPPAGGMAGGPIAPYSAPGAGAGGAGGATPAAPAAATSPASASASGSGGGGPAAGPVMAAGHGSAGAAAGLVASSDEVNPDLLLAQRVLGGLVRACENWPSLIVWAVSVVKTPLGSQIIIATSAGGGGYVPPPVVLPTTARLAVVDPVLPFGWAARWMGCQRPSKILADHFELFRKKTAGAQLSAMVTTELWPQAPDGVRDFLGMQHRDALALASEAPRLDGAHQHRLAAFDPGLAHRIATLSRDPQVSLGTAWNVTAAVVDAAHAEQDVSGDKLATDDELAVLRAVHRGTADAVGWGLYDSLADKRHGGVLAWPETHAPQDFDGSKLNHDTAHVYRKYFRMSQIVELVRCWKYSPPPLADLVYCGIHAGFGATVVAKISELEQHLRSQQ